MSIYNTDKSKRELPVAKLPISTLKELWNESTRVVSWYAHPMEVRGPFCRWFTVSEVSPEYKKHVAYEGDDCKYAAAAMNNLPHLIDQIEQLEKRNERLTKSIEDAAIMVLPRDCSMCSAGSAREDLLEALED